MDTELTTEERTLLYCNLDTICELCGEVIPAGAEYCPGCDENLEDITIEPYSVWLECAGRDIELC
jgi:hypothetical protein